MKNLFKKNIGILCIAGSLAFGCDNKLDVVPKDTINADQALETSSDIEALLVGAYDVLGNQHTVTGAVNGDLYGGNLLRNAELIATDDELFWDGTYVAPGERFNKRILVNNDQAEGMWVQSYNVINITNNVLANLDKVDEGIQDKVEGEAKFIRGTVYFELVKMYAKTWIDGDPATNMGAPLVLTPTDLITEENNVTRASVAEIYTQVLSDLQDAADLLPEENGFFATQSAAQAMLSRVYLMQQNYAQAAAMADSVISSELFALNASYASSFNNGTNTPEDIFAMQITSQDGASEMNEFFAGPAYSGRGDIYIDSVHLALYDAADARLALFYEDEDLGGVRTGKWKDQFGNINILRLAEMYLTRAEANFRLGTAVGAAPLADINTIRARAGIAPLAALTIDDILLERHKELAFEGHRIHDLKRTGRAVSAELPFNSPRLIFPIPQREMDANPGLQGQQNEGYI